MPKIVIIDDRKDLRDTISTIVQGTSPDGWTCEAYPPLDDISGYVDFINNEDVAVLILDELLHEQAGDSESHADYNGHDVAALIRKQIPVFPIHIITSHKGDEGLQDNQSDLDSIFARDEFSQTPDKFVPIIVRSAMRFLEVNEENLAAYTTLSEKVAMGSLGTEEEQRLSALKQELNLRYSDAETKGVSDSVSEIERNLQEMNDMIATLNKIIKD